MRRIYTGCSYRDRISSILSIYLFIRRAGYNFPQHTGITDKIKVKALAKKEKDSLIAPRRLKATRALSLDKQQKNVYLPRNRGPISSNITTTIRTTLRKRTLIGQKYSRRNTEASRTEDHKRGRVASNALTAAHRGTRTYFLTTNSARRRNTTGTIPKSIARSCQLSRSIPRAYLVLLPSPTERLSSTIAHLFLDHDL